jgi:hypothetical protein
MIGVLSVILLALAQVTAGLAPPALSFVLDGSGQLRPVVGISGSASVGAPLELGFGITQIVVSPGHDYILASVAGQDSPVLLQLRRGALSVWPLNQLPKVDLMAPSASGTAAAFLSQSDGRVYALRQLADSAMPAGQFDVSGIGPITTLAISDDGQTLAVGTSDGLTGSVFLVDAAGPPRLIAFSRHPSAIRFFRDSRNAIIADDMDNTVLMLSQGQVFTLANAQDGISTPIAVAISSDSQKVFVGNSQTASITTIDLPGKVEAPVYCNCSLTGLHPTSADSVFRINDFSGGPILLFDASSDRPRITYAPDAFKF